MRHRLDFGGLSDWFTDGKSSLTIDEVCSENGVDQSGFSEPCLSCEIVSRVDKLGRDSFTNTDNVELKAPFEQFSFDLLGNGVEPNMAS